LNDVARNRPGYIAGLRDGDIVIEFDGIPIRTSRELVSRIERTLPDSIVKIVVMRGSERLEIPVKIGVDD
jgi:S1-C subfamily serine protease